MSITCDLRIDGRPVPDQAATYDTLPTAMDGLTVTWGRRGRLQQPEPATCQVDIHLNTDTIARDLEWITPGASVEVTATRQTADAPTLTLITDTTRYSIDAPGGYPVERVWAPAPASNDPAAWEHIPTVTYGTRYQVQTRIVAAAPATTTVTPLYYDAPDAQPTVGAPLQATSDGVYEWVPELDRIGLWVGVRITVANVGPTWATAQQKTWDASPVTWVSYRTVTIHGLTLSRTGIITRSSTVFYGRIATAPMEWNRDAARPVIHVTATDIRAELGHLRIGDEPWPVETARKRIDRIIALSRVAITVVTPPAFDTTLLAAKDIDSRSVIDLLGEIAKSTGTVLWVAAHERVGAYLRFELPTDRVALYQLTTDKNGHLGIAPAASAAAHLPARLIDLDGLSIEQDTTDLASQVSVRWEDSDEHEHAAIVTDPDRNLRYGYRSLSVSTDLTSHEDATVLAQSLLKQTAPGGWTIPAATYTPDETQGENVMRLLDATSRLGHPLILDNVVHWMPGAPGIPVYLDGATATYTRATWQMHLSLTRGATPAKSVTWKTIPTTARWRDARLTWLEISSAQP